MKPGPPVDNIVLCGPFAASFRCEITGNGDKADIQPGVGSVEHTHMEGHRLMSLLIV